MWYTLPTFATANHILVYDFNIDLVYFHILKYIKKKLKSQTSRLWRWQLCEVDGPGETRGPIFLSNMNRGAAAGAAEPLRDAEH